MARLVTALCLVSLVTIYAGSPAGAADMRPVYKAPPAQVAEPMPPGPSRYYSDYWNYGFWSGYGPFADCNGGRCYIGPPFQRGPHGRRQYGQYYYGPTGGYYHESTW